MLKERIEAMKRLEDMILNSIEIKRVIDEFGYEMVADYITILAIEEDYSIYDLNEAFYKELWALEEALETLEK